MKMKFSSLGDEHILIDLGGRVSKETLYKVMAYSNAISPFVLECNTAYTTLMVRYNSLEQGYDSLVEKLKNIIKNTDSTISFTPKTHIVNVSYGGEYGQDLKRVADYNNISEKQVINLHTQNIYTVYMIGFLPGFCYLGGMDKGISTPRLDVPRKKIEKGSVGIAGIQTGVYPVQSPGGWNIIGRTEYEFFEEKDPPCLVKPGDCIKFVEV